ncbi:hypothetical protein Franean1_1323 [Parafrankia sp. EAN1pec]|uniref:hypothetical protein n=1 Tax=Parafrankia sp. (strain EAN1pec) TaxID=298653 RepID=UPI0000543D71|nr:hypothetical protein Franean1_1323 [Frankia sp. EAN1pec]
MPRMICAVCSRPLVSIRVHGLEIWAHAPGHAEDGTHMPVPVDDTGRSVRQRCDFCSTEPAVGLLPVAGEIWMPPFSVSADQPWAVCATCRDLISADRWDDLVHRTTEKIIAADVMPDLTVRSLLAELGRMIRQIRAQVTGPVEPLDEPNS